MNQRSWLRLLAVLGPVVALLVASFLPAGLAALILPPASDAGAGEPRAGEVVGYVVVAASITCAIAIGLTAVLARIHGLRLRDVGLRWSRSSLRSGALGLGLGAGVVLIVGLPLGWAGALRGGDELGLPWWAIALAGGAQALVLQGFPEELLFRGYQMAAVRLRPVAALMISSATFGAMHLISNGGQQNVAERVLYLAMPFGFAFAGGALMIVTDSLWSAVGVHAGLHVGTVAGVFLGLGTGPVLWVSCGAVWVASGIGLLAIARRRGRLGTIWPGPRESAPYPERRVVAVRS